VRFLTVLLSSAAQRADEQEYLRLLGSVLESYSFYFSYTMDLTHSLQRIAGMPNALCCYVAASLFGDVPVCRGASRPERKSSSLEACRRTILLEQVLLMSDLSIGHDQN